MKPIRSQSVCDPQDRRQCLRGLVSLALLVAGKFANAVPQTPILVFAGTEDIDHSQGVWLEMIYREAVRRIGFQLEYRVYPAKRASALADSGAVDGEIHRVMSYGTDHPNLILVPAPHFFTSFAAYGLAPMKLSDGWHSLGADRLRVEYRAGVVYCEQKLPSVVPAIRLSAAYRINLCLRKLLHHRTDIYVDDERSVDLELQDDEFKGSMIRRLAIMEVVGTFSYLNKRHSNLVPRLAEVLNDMRREGTIEKYRKQAYGESM